LLAAQERFAFGNCPFNGHERCWVVLFHGGWGWPMYQRAMQWSNAPGPAAALSGRTAVYALCGRAQQLPTLRPPSTPAVGMPSRQDYLPRSSRTSGSTRVGTPL
jgi:hypothetical protein